MESNNGFPPGFIFCFSITVETKRKMRKNERKKSKNAENLEQKRSRSLPPEIERKANTASKNWEANSDWPRKLNEKIIQLRKRQELRKLTVVKEAYKFIVNQESQE